MKLYSSIKLLIFIILAVPAVSVAESKAGQEALGKLLFFDNNLSSPAGRSCASCHDPRAGYADPDGSMPVSRGAIAGRFTNRNTPTITYASFVPRRYFDNKEKHFVGGLFLDGRETSLPAQAQGPLLSPLEMNNGSKLEIVNKVRRASYAHLFKTGYGTAALDTAETAFIKILQALAAYEQGREVNTFDSRYDRYLMGQAKLTARELRGLEIFEKEDKGNCAACHPSTRRPDGALPLFTDFTYDNLGVPANKKNPFLNLPEKFNPDGKQFVDFGLGKSVNKKAEYGKFRVPTLRNIALTAPYMHNGVFATLKEVVEFYNERDVSKRWGSPEVADNVNREELGDLKLTEQDVDDLVAFMETLTDARLEKMNQ
jgi:cytochrome c peroxidase